MRSDSISRIKHKEYFGSPLFNNFITTDFADAQTELVTPVFSDENELLAIFNPLIKADSLWKPHSLYIMAEYYLSKNQMQKSKEFFEQIVSLENNNSKIKTKAQKRLRSSFSE